MSLEPNYNPIIGFIKCMFMGLIIVLGLVGAMIAIAIFIEVSITIVRYLFTGELRLSF